MKKTQIIAMFLLPVILSAETFDEVYAKGIDAIHKGNAEQARTFFKEAETLAADQTQKTNAVLQQSLTMMNAPTDALKLLTDYRESAGALPTNLTAALNLRIGECAYRSQRYDEARQSLESALSAKKLSSRDQSLAYKVLSNTLIRLKTYDEANKTAEQWKDMADISADDYAAAMLLQGTCVLLANPDGDPVKFCDEALQIKNLSSPMTSMIYQQKAYFLLTLKRPQEALKAVEASAAVAGRGWGYNKELHDRIVAECQKSEK